MTIGFIGLGIMGERMASNLLKQGNQLIIWNRSKNAVEKLVEQGATAAESPKAVAEQATVIFSMLSTPAVVEQLFLGNTGVLNAMQKGSIWVDCSTVNPAFSLSCHQAAAAAGVQFLEAPVAGTKPHAANAELVFFVGGTAELLEQVQVYLNQMGKKVLHIGEAGKGGAFKMLVNLMLAQSMVVFSEAVLLGEQLGMDTDFLLNTLPNLVVAAPFTKAKASMIQAGDYEVQFPLEWMHKDLHLACLTAYEQAQPLYLANATKELFAAAKQAGLGRLDFAAIHRYLGEKG